MQPALGPELPRVAGETAPRTWRSRVTSHLVRIEIGCSTRGQVGQSFIGQCVQQVLGLGKSARPSLLENEFGLQPSGNPILLVGRKGRQPGEDVLERLSHASRILSGRLPNKPLHLSVPQQGHCGIIETPGPCGGPAGERQGVGRTKTRVEQQISSKVLGHLTMLLIATFGCTATTGGPKTVGGISRGAGEPELAQHYLADSNTPAAFKEGIRAGVVVAGMCPLQAFAAAWSIHGPA